MSEVRRFTKRGWEGRRRFVSIQCSGTDLGSVGNAMYLERTRSRVWKRTRSGGLAKWERERGVEKGGIHDGTCSEGPTGSIPVETPIREET